jgi:hypothetical protein
MRSAMRLVTVNLRRVPALLSNSGTATPKTIRESTLTVCRRTVHVISSVFAEGLVLGMLLSEMWKLWRYGKPYAYDTFQPAPAPPGWALSNGLKLELARRLRLIDFGSVT